MQELYCRNIFTSVRPFLEKFIESTRFILGGSPYPGKDGKKMAKLLEEGYRMQDSTQCPYTSSKACS